MTKRTPRGRGIRADGRSKNTGESFVRLPHRLIDSPAFRALTPAARTVLILLMARYSGNPAHNGELPFAAREAEPWGVSRTVAVEAIDLLIAFDFIKCTRDAAMLGRLARRWACSELPTTDGNGREVAPTFTARRLSETDVKRIMAELVQGRKQARSKRDPDSLQRLLKNKARPDTRTQSSGHADTKSESGPKRAVVSGHADAIRPSDATLRPDTRTASRSTRGVAETARPVLRVVRVSESGEAAPDRPSPRPARKSPPDPAIAAKIRQLMASGMNQREIGAGIGHSRSHVAAVLQGVNRLRPDALVRLEELLARRGISAPPAMPTARTSEP